MRPEKKISEDNAFFNVRFGGRKFVKETKKIKPVLTQEESEKIILSARNSQERFMVAMALKTALRRSEIANIKMSDIDGCKIRITSKGGDEYYTHLNTTLCDMLNEYIQDRDTDSEYLFYGIKGVQSADGRITGTSVNNRVRACAKRAGIEKNITAHRLRATAITNAAVNHGMALAQGLARHKSISTTNIYVNTEEAVKNLLLED